MRDGGFGERGGDGPGIRDVVGLEPLEQGGLAVALGEGIVGGVGAAGVVGHRAAGARDPGAVLGRLGVGETEVAEAVFEVAVLAQFGEEAGGGALGGGGWVVELVGEVAGELAEGGELFGLLLHAGDLADAVEQGGDAALRHGRDGGEHVRGSGTRGG